MRENMAMGQTLMQGGSMAMMGGPGGMGMMGAQGGHAMMDSCMKMTGGAAAGDR